MDLLHQIETFIERTRIPPTRFGRLAVGDPRLVGDLRAGRKPRRKLEEKVKSYLDCSNLEQ
jgi:hypothetical protein